MKTKLILALITVGFVVAISHLASAQETAEEQPIFPVLPTLQPIAFGGIEFRRWHQGQPPVKLIRQEEGFCALTSVGGGFAGGAEMIHVYVGSDGYWYLDGKSQQHGVDAECVVVRYSVLAKTVPQSVPATTARPGSAPTKHVKVLAASFSFGSHYADVTARVKKLLRDGEEFRAAPDWLRVDPEPGWNKVLVIFCKVGGRRAIFSVGEGEPVSRALLLAKAQLVSDQASPHPGSDQTKMDVPAADASDDARPQAKF